MPDHTYRVEKSIINIDKNITDNIIRKVTDVQWEKCRTKNEAPALTGYSWKDFPCRTT